MKMHFGQTSLFGIALFGFSTLLLADAVPHAAVMSPTAEDDVRVVVSATRGWAQDPLDVPQAVSVLSADVLNETVYSSLEAALQRLPNMGLAQAGQPYSSSQGANTSSNYWQEGFSIRGLGGPRVLVLTDGVRQAGQGIGYGGGNLSLYDFYAIERVEVLRGPASVMYGTDAFGGVVSVTTREPSHRAQFGLGGKARISFDGSRNMWRTGGYINAGDKNFACVVGASMTESKNPHAPKGATIDGGAFKSYGAWLKADYLLSEKSRIRFLANTTQVQDIKVADRDIKHPKLSKPMHLNVEIPLYSRSEVGVEWVGSDLSEKVEEAKIGFFWQGLHRHFNWDAPRFVHKYPMREDRSVRTTNDRANTFELQPMMRFNFEPHMLVVGADIARDDVKLQDQRTERVYRFLTPAVDPLNPIGKETVNQSSTIADACQYRVGFYAQDRIELEPFELIFGGRFDTFYVKDEKNDVLKKPCGVSGSASSVYHWNEETSSYLTLASGFRAPDLGERFQETTVVLMLPATVFGNPNLKPERSYSAEFGTKHRGKFWTVEVATFINQIDDYIGQKKLPNPTNPMEGRFSYDNLGGVLLYGFEAQAALFPVPEWQLYAGTGRTYTEQGSKIALPGWVFNFGTAYTYSVNEGYLTFIKPEIRGTAATSSFDTLNKVRYPGFGVFDIQLTFGLKACNDIEGTLIIGLKNVFDKAYYLPFFGSPTERLNAQPGRGVFTAIELSF